MNKLLSILALCAVGFIGCANAGYYYGNGYYNNNWYGYNTCNTCAQPVVYQAPAVERVCTTTCENVMVQPTCNTCAPVCNTCS